MSINLFLASELEGIDNSMKALSIVHCSEKEYASQEAQPGPPHEAFLFVLAYLSVNELLVMSEVCVLLRDAVRKDVLPWLDIIIDRPLNSRLTNEILMKITSKANGKLRTLALVNCLKITDDGLQRVIERNPFISQLHISGCTGLTPDGIIRAVKTLTEHHNSLKSLRMEGIYNINKEHLKTLQSHVRNPELENAQAEASPIDVEICPKCDEVRMVFDCTKEKCRRARGRLFADCKGCKFCIARCAECGGCVDSEELEEAACADILCSDCWLCLPKCDLCNKPYCKQHANRQISSSNTSGFVCDVCHFKAIEDSDKEAE